MVIFVRGHAHHRRYDKKEELKKKEGTGWRKKEREKVEKEQVGRPHSAPLQLLAVQVSPTPPPDNAPANGGHTIESRLGIVKKNRRSNSASSLVGLSCIDLTRDDSKETRKKINEYINAVGGKQELVAKDRRSNSLPTTLDVDQNEANSRYQPLVEHRTPPTPYNPPEALDVCVPFIGNGDVMDFAEPGGALDGLLEEFVLQMLE